MKPFRAGLTLGIVVALGAGGCASDGSRATSPRKPRATQSQPSGLRTDLQPPPPEQTVRAAIAATRKLRSVHVTGAATYGGRLVGLDLSVAQDGSCAGKIAFPDGRPITDATAGDLVSQGGRIYLRGSEAFYRSLAGPAEGAGMASSLRGRWLKISTSTMPPLSELCSLDHYRGFFDMADVRQSMAVERGAHDEINGAPVLEIVLNQKVRNLHAWVAEGGGPRYIVRIQMPGDDSHPDLEVGQVTFSAFNSPVRVTIPRASQTFTPEVSR